MADNQRDLVLAPNEYAYVLDSTKGNVTCWVGPNKTSLSQSDKLVRFDNDTKEFIECSYEQSIHLFETAPEGWYITLKNPAPEGRHPTPGAANTIPENMLIGKKVNITGPCSFALYPGQMAKITQGHRLRSNQYLVARVYDADSLPPKPEVPMSIEEGVYKSTSYVNGEILIIKGTEQPFYIPPTGIEVMPIQNNSKNGYVRDAVTLERLQYCILKDENGRKRYLKGPAVVFPEPTEAFIKDENGNLAHQAFELSDISGVYVKVIADYDDYHVGDELFITGKEQKIYYPRPEHTFIKYGDQVVHHAIAIPKGEGRYIMNRNTGEITIVRGPAMYLPDPRTEVVVQRTLSKKQCELWYPGNEEVLIVNGHNTEDAERTIYNTSTISANLFNKALDRSIVTNYCYQGTPTQIEEIKDLTRGTSYTKPRTISLNSSKYDGAVSVDIWTGYAVNVISKDGTRQVVCGPKTILLDYDQTLETLNLSTGKPKTTDILEPIVFLKYVNNKISDIINVETSDFVKVQIKVSYNVDFDTEYCDKWFDVDNYVKHLTDRCRSRIKNMVKLHNIHQLYANYHSIVYDSVFGNDHSLLFPENGMNITDIDVLSIFIVDEEIRGLIENAQEEGVNNLLKLIYEQQSFETAKQLDSIKREKMELESARKQLEIALNKELRVQNIEAEEIANSKRALANQKELEYRLNEKTIALDIAAKDHEKIASENALKLKFEKEQSIIAAEREKRAAQNLKTVLEAVGPELAAAMQNRDNADIMSAIAQAVSPYAIAQGDGVADTINKVVRGTTLEQLTERFTKE